MIPADGEVYSIQLYIVKLSISWTVLGRWYSFSGYFIFFTIYSWRSQHNWNIVDSEWRKNL